MATNLTNTQIINQLGLPADITTGLQSKETEVYTAASNQFISALFNKICYQRIESMDNFDNPFKKFDSFPIEFGDTIENIFIDFPQGQKYDKGSTDPFTTKANAIKKLYATLNYQMQYAATIYRDLLKQAVLGEYGFMGIINGILESINKSKDIDEYTAEIQLLNNPDLYAGGFTALNCDSAHLNLTDVPSAAHYMAKLMRSTVKDFAIPSSDNNAIGVKNLCSLQNSLVVCKQSLLDSIDMDYLVGVFNYAKIDIASQVIPVRSFMTNPITGTTPVGSADIDFVIIDKKAFDNHVALQDSGSIYNPKGRYTNTFTDDWRVFGFKRWYNAKAYKIDNAPTGLVVKG